ncbi:MAG TPA: carboxypeptidase regulatory-like domain-containing protein [Vicinamibacterales bacterium]|nr:carboxypeptidase regulatory-like domain-containing protein [Vicinamibacterales bacterium]
MSSEVLVPARRRRSPESGRWFRSQEVVALTAAAAVVLVALGPAARTDIRAASGGTIKGRITFTGPEPGNRVIRMGMDPMCAAANQGKRPVNEIYLVGDGNTLGNVFVKVDGSFPATPVPSTPVEIDQRACIYTPRVVGARVGQTLRVRNSDNWLHNVHTDSAKRNGINQSTPKAGLDVNLVLKDEEMLRIGCDVHRWMTAWVGIVSHPYFAVSEGQNGTFTIANVPAGHRTITAWHEAFGTLTKTVDVNEGQTVTVNFVYTQKPG